MNAAKIFLLGGIVILLTLNTLIVKKELNITKSQEIKIALRPVDPRSIMQGDYMRLRYKIPQKKLKEAKSGKLLISIDKQGFVLDYELYEKQKLKKNQALLNFKQKKWGNIFIGSESYLFEEGKADHYAKATHAIFYLTPTGETILKDLYIPPQASNKNKDDL